MKRALVFSVVLGFLATTVVACNGGGSSDTDDGSAGSPSDDGSGGKSSSTGGKSSGGSSTGGKGSGGSSSGGSDGEGGGGAGGGDGAPTEWLGTTPHFDLRGTVDGAAFEQVLSAEQADNTSWAVCERNYIVPDLNDESEWADEAYLEKIEVKVSFLDQDGNPGEFQLELYRDELLDSVGQTFDIPSDAGVEAGLEVEDADYEWEGEATSGTVYLGIASGEPGDNGLIPDEEGQFGLFVDVQFESGDSVRGSFTVNCGENDLETPE